MFAAILLGAVPDILVLAYHAASDDWPAALAVRPERFEQQLMMLVERGYRGATCYSAVHGTPFPRTVAITFDDAYRSVIDVAFPILQRVGFPATVFVPTNYCDRSGDAMSWPGISQWVGGPHEHELQPLTWSQLRTLGDAGWEIGAHSLSHPDLTQLSDARLDEELRGPRARCEHELGCACTSLAYPFGAHDERVVEAARRAGYRTACTVPDRLTAVDYLTWPRIGVWRHDGSFAFRLKISPTVRRLRQTPAADLSMRVIRSTSNAARRAGRDGTHGTRPPRS